MIWSFWTLCLGRRFPQTGWSHHINGFLCDFYALFSLLRFATSAAADDFNRTGRILNSCIGVLIAVSSFLENQCQNQYFWPENSGTSHEISRNSLNKQKPGTSMIKVPRINLKFILMWEPRYDIFNLTFYVKG